MTGEKELVRGEAPMMDKFSLWDYAARIEIFFKKKSIEAMGLVNPMNLEASGQQAIQLIEAEIMDQPTRGQVPSRPARAVFLPSDDVLQLFVRAIAHYSCNKEVNLMKRFAFGPSN